MPWELEQRSPKESSESQLNILLGFPVLSSDSFIYPRNWVIAPILRGSKYSSGGFSFKKHLILKVLVSLDYLKENVLIPKVYLG